MIDIRPVCRLLKYVSWHKCFSLSLFHFLGLSIYLYVPVFEEYNYICIFMHLSYCVSICLSSYESFDLGFHSLFFIDLQSIYLLFYLPIWSLYLCLSLINLANDFDPVLLEAGNEVHHPHTC